MSTPVSILLPHFRTEEMVRLCLRLIRHRTQGRYEVVVVDNGSGDHPSLAYLRTVNWIRLLVRAPEDVNADPNVAHREALQLALDASQYDFVLSLHTDAFVLRDDWLSWLLQPFVDNSRISAVGTFKLAYQSPWRHWLTDLKHRHRRIDRARANSPYIRSHCALYRRDIMRKIGLGFASDETAGRELFFEMLTQGYQPKLLSVREMSKYVAHINHGTMAFNPELCGRDKTVTATAARAQRFFQSPSIQQIYANDQLDR